MRTLTKIVPVLALVSATGSAQTPPPAGAGSGSAVPPPVADTETASGTATVEGSATLTVDVPAPKLALADAQKKAGAADKQIHEDMRFVLYLKEQAKKQSDVIKLSCVNDRIVQLKAQMNLADGTKEQLDESFTRNTDDRHSLLVTYEGQANGIRRLREEAVGCIGEPELYKQESGNNTSDHPPIVDDPTQDQPFEPELEPPGYASPYF